MGDIEEPLTSADFIREMKKEALDVFGTRARFPEAAGILDDTLGHYFRGERQMPTNVLLHAIHTLGVTPEVFAANARQTRAVATRTPR